MFKLGWLFSNFYKIQNTSSHLIINLINLDISIKGSNLYKLLPFNCNENLIQNICRKCLISIIKFPRSRLFYRKNRKRGMSGLKAHNRKANKSSRATPPDAFVPSQCFGFDAAGGKGVPRGRPLSHGPSGIAG